jgi:hypothetical protein
MWARSCGSPRSPWPGAAVLRWPWLPSRVPAWAHRLAFPVIVAVFVVDFYASRETLPVLVRVELLLLVYRLVSYRKRRDDLQIVILGLFLVVVAGVLTVSLFFAVQILAFTACSLGFLLLTTLVDAGRASEPPGGAGGGPGLGAGGPLGSAGRAGPGGG